MQNAVCGLSAFILNLQFCILHFKLIIPIKQRSLLHFRR